MRFVYVSDLHGDEKKYLASLNYAKKHQINLIVNGGDALPKLGNLYEDQPQFIEGFFMSYLKKLEEANITYLTMLGNDDLECLDGMYESVCAKFKNVHYLANREVQIDGYSFVGMDRVLDHPFKLKSRIVLENETRLLDRSQKEVLLSGNEDFIRVNNWISYATNHLKSMQDVLKELPIPENLDKTIYVMHMPPLGLGLGVMYNGEDIGSEAIYSFLKEKQPLLSLHGHIHECCGKWMSGLRNTRCIQPGQTELDACEMVLVDCDLENDLYERVRVAI